mgnify:CR=1 FL=1
MLVQRFYDLRRAAVQEKLPNPAHEALARLDARWPGGLLIATQNIDDLHERAGARRLIHMHGELLRAWCLACNDRFSWDSDMSTSQACPRCRKRSSLRELPFVFRAFFTLKRCARSSWSEMGFLLRFYEGSPSQE